MLKRSMPKWHWPSRSCLRHALIERALEAQHGQALKEVQELERGIEIAERAVQLGREEIIREAETDAQHFNQLAAPYESRAGIAWLRKDGDKVVVVDLDRKVSRQPTPEELATGHISPTLRNTARQWFAGRRQHECSMNDRPVNANTIEQIDREAQELVSANQAFSKRKQAEGLRDGVAHKPIAGGDMNLKIVGGGR